MPKSRVALAAAVAILAAPGAASARDYADTALNILPHGQYGSVPAPPEADDQALMYDALTPLFDDVDAADLQRTFKSAALGVGPDGPGREEEVPRRGVTIVRDRFNVPHITGRTRDDVTWAMGWVTAQDRALLLAQGRYPARLAAIDAPNIDAFSLVTGLKQYRPTRQVERMVRRQGMRALRRAGRAGRRLLHDIDVYVRGLNARLRRDDSSQDPFTRVDVFAVNALVGQIFGEGGGGEAPRSAFLGALQDRLGTGRGLTLFDDLTAHTDPDSEATLARPFPYSRVGRTRAGNVILDRYRPVSPPGARAATAPRRWASNFLVVGADRSSTGHPLFVAGPQIGYTYPGLTLEVDVRGPGFQARGATAPGFPGNVLIGRGEDFAWSLTSAGSDIVDTFAVRLCGGSDTRYRHRGRCKRMGAVDAGAIQGEGRVRFRTTVHGPVIGYGTSDGRRYALARKRASYGRDILFQLPFRDMTLGKVDSARRFVRALARSPFTFNAVYADDRDIAMFSAGRLPVRDRRVDPRLPTKGSRRYAWKGFLPRSRHPQAINPRSDLLVNWNNRPAPEFAAADDNWSWGSAHRVRLLEQQLGTRATHDLASVTGAMNAAATQDLRNVVLAPRLAELLAAAPAPSPRAARMLELLLEWRAAGSSRLDRDLDGVMDAGAGPVVMDALYPELFEAVMGPVLGPQLEDLRRFVGGDATPGSGFTGGGFWYLDEILGTVTGNRFAEPHRTRFCASRDACTRAAWAAFEAAGAAAAAAQGNPDPDTWRADATAERIAFVPGLLPTTIRYTNRPSGIQQVISFDGHRPR